MSKVDMKCPYCHEEILQANPTTCPYCGIKILVSDEEASGLDIEEIEKLERAGRYEDAAHKI
jgi:DNA-directed RNA polymerase subunit RPC12/RpoP